MDFKFKFNCENKSEALQPYDRTAIHNKDLGPLLFESPPCVMHSTKRKHKSNYINNSETVKK